MKNLHPHGQAVEVHRKNCWKVCLSSYSHWPTLGLLSPLRVGSPWSANHELTCQFYSGAPGLATVRASFLIIPFF
jgi:hypothetical protein